MNREKDSKIIKSKPSFENLPWRFLKELANKIPLNGRWALASVNKEFYKIVALNDRYKHSIYFRGDQVSVKSRMKQHKFSLNFENKF